MRLLQAVAAVDRELVERALVALDGSIPSVALEAVERRAGTSCAASISPLRSAATIASALLKLRITTSRAAGLPRQ